MSEQDSLKELRIDRADRDGSGHRGLRLVLAILVVGALGGGTYYAVSEGPIPVDVSIAQAPAAGPTAVLDATGYVIARRQATVSSKISGKLAEVLIEEGVQVEADQLLARLDDTDAKAQLDLARARLAAAQARLGEIQVQLEQNRRGLKRQTELRSRQLASEEALETAATQVETLSAQLEAQRSQVRVSEAEVQVALVAYDNTVVRAPFAGVIVAKAAQPGEIVSPMSAGGGFTRTGIGTVVDMGSLEIEVDVNEAFINRVRPDQPVQAVLDAYPDWTIPASVIAIIPTADRSKATVRVRIRIDAKDPRLIPEMGVRVSFLQDDTRVSDGTTAGVLIPASAIREHGDGSIVFVLDGDHVRERQVTAGDEIGDRRLVEQGLAAGERVVRDPPLALADGMRVSPRGEVETP
ncbi:efflux RND transporter periplasmic adaptor subunit [Thiocapsa sp.]|uniref:efflux RND transporter periplasmic adaptor subunit n=1 Tax=Thiocapsa sp. TaxID=2024551 RepID=UPI002C7B6C23|nr:efflux RND transporter periplasmic adaptor subunit [Thiocapsa sp.]HSO84416.1 efflux RND transporter periplasmic adaptor subunit [Thiocapsa sp.]